MTASSSPGLIHFSGVAGAGMNPLAQLFAQRGYAVSGSDRAFDRGECAVIRDLLSAQGISILPHDGSAITEQISRVIHSTAVELTTPELAAAQAQGIPLVTRPALLAEVVAAATPGVAVAGTSGKSTVVGMVAWIMQSCQHPLTVLGGAALASGGANHMGCFLGASTDFPLVVEACESDGTLVGYHPSLGVVHNISRDHHEVAQLRGQFSTFMGHCERLLICADDALAMECSATHPARLTYGTAAEADWRLDPIRLGPWRAQGQIHHGDEQWFLDLPQPGRHSLDNGLAALVITAQLGISPAAAAAALADFPGVARRFQVLGTTDQGITVVDDYAHNGAKIAAAVAAAQQGCDRLLAIFQPHGFGPARFLRPELRELLPNILRPGDRWCYAPIFYAGGTVAQDISVIDLAADLCAQLPCHAADSHEAVLTWVTSEAMPGDTVLLMGARDPRLGDLATCIFDLL